MMNTTTNDGSSKGGYREWVAPVVVDITLRAWNLAKVALGPNASAADLMTRTLQIIEVL